MDRRVAHGAVLVPHTRLVVQRGDSSGCGRIVCSNRAGDTGVALEAKLANLSTLQHLGVLRTMRDVAGSAAFQLNRGMLENEWTGLIGVALDTARIGTDGQPRLLRLETAVRIVTVAALHRALEHLMVKGLGKLLLLFVVATQAELRLTLF